LKGTISIRRKFVNIVIRSFVRLIGISKFIAIRKTASFTIKRRYITNGVRVAIPFILYAKIIPEPIVRTSTISVIITQIATLNIYFATII
jgi:hypothetical protein